MTEFTDEQIEALLPDPDLENHEIELWGQNAKDDFWNRSSIRTIVRAALAAQPAQAAPVALVSKHGYLCKAWGESDLPVARFAETLAEVGAFLCDEWFGEQPETMHPNNREQYDSAMSEISAIETDRDAWDGMDSWTATFEIGGISITRCHYAAPATVPAPVQAGEPVAEVCSGWRIAFVGSEPIAAVLARHPEVRIGTKLYTHPAPPMGPQEAVLIERIALWLEPQRNDIPATGAEFAAALRAAAAMLATKQEPEQPMTGEKP